MDDFSGVGIQIHRVRGRKRSTPEWAKDDKQIQGLLLQAFPRLQEDGAERRRAGIWARIIYLHFRKHLTYGQVASEMTTAGRPFNEGQVRAALQRIRRVANGWQSNKKALRGKRKVGRPRIWFGKRKRKPVRKDPAVVALSRRLRRLRVQLGKVEKELAILQGGSRDSQ